MEVAWRWQAMNSWQAPDAILVTVVRCIKRGRAKLRGVKGFDQGAHCKYGRKDDEDPPHDFNDTIFEAKVPARAKMKKSAALLLRP